MQYENEIKKLKYMVQKKGGTLNPILSLEEIAEIETEYNISFPEEYVAFLNMLGDGGALLGDNKKDILVSLKNCDLSRISKNFPYQGTISWEDQAYNYAEDPDGKVDLSKNGCVSLVDRDDGFEWVLIVSGPCRGECWLISSERLMRGENLSFLKWLELYLEETVDDWITKINQTTADFESYKKMISKKIKRFNIQMNPTISIQAVRAIEDAHGISLPSDYVRFITEFGDGCKFKALYYNRKVEVQIRSIYECNLSYITLPFPLIESGSVEEDMANHGNICFFDVHYLNLPGNRFIHQSFHLITSGKYKGEVWCHLDNKMLDVMHLPFHRWFNLYVKDQCVI